jgi:hypothetical protein
VTAPGTGARQARTLAWIWLAFPVLVLLLLTVLVALDINGSSISQLVTPAQRVGLLAGRPRPIRSDEMLVRTPIAVSSVEQDFPASPWIGLAQTDQAATAHGGPTRDWSTLFKTQDWGYLVLGSSRGLAFSWWWSFAVSLLGCYALFGMVTRSRGLAALIAVAATFTPYSAWWTAPAPSLFLGYAAGIGALLIAAWSATEWRSAAACALGASAISVAFALALYPPWQVSLVWVVALVCLGVALDRRLAWRRIAWTTAATVSLAGAGVVAWYLDHSAAIAAVVGTHYPGDRLVQAGGADLATMLSAPLNFWLAGRPGATLGTVAYTGPKPNLSEVASTWLSLPVLLLVLAWCGVVLASHLRARRARDRGDANGAARWPTGPIWTLALASVAALVLLAWAFLPLPAAIGKVTQLDRVPPARVSLALGLAVLLQVVAASMIHPRPARSALWLVGAAALTGATAYWAHKHLPWHSSLVPGAFVVVSGILLGAAFALLATPRRALVGGALLSVLAVTSWSLVNPLQRGLGGVVTDPLVTELRSLAAGGDNPRVEVFGDLVAVAKVRIAGLQSLGGVTLYPDSVLMGRLAPSQEARWNNYAQYLWSPAPPGSLAVITADQGTRMKLAIDPCDPVLLDYVHPGWAISAEPLVDASCLNQVSVVSMSDGQEFRIYRVSQP